MLRTHDLAGTQPRSGERVQPTPQGVGQANKIDTSPEGAKENAVNPQFSSGTRICEKILPAPTARSRELVLSSHADMPQDIMPKVFHSSTL